MKLLDLLKLSISNLKRRKIRTVLTVFGVLIGTASVVTMVSLGIGLNELNKESIAQFGSLKEITVNVPYTYDEKTSKTEPLYIKDETIDTFSKLEHVVGVSPVLRSSVILMQGSYQLNTDIIGVNKHYLESIELGRGHLPLDEKKLEFLYGNTVVINFYNSKKKYNSYFETGELPNINYDKTMFVVFDTETYGASQAGGENAPKPPKKYVINTAGVVKGEAVAEDFSNYNQYSNGIYCNIDALKTMLKKIYKSKPIPGQPTTKSGKPLKYFTYDEAKIYVDDMNNVTAVQKLISDMGYQTDSNMDWIEQSQASANIMQMVLGGIGAVSLFVASIGIANTMMMSIYERTKEIGIMKVLGCDMNRIRDMFLIESGAIGLIGGLTGVILSYIISYVINSLGVAAKFSDVQGDLSRIPLWLVLSAIIFAVFVGMLAGFFPAIRAMRLSPLSALRND